MSILVSRIIGNYIPGRYEGDAPFEALELILRQPQPQYRHFVLNRLYKDRERYLELLSDYGFVLNSQSRTHQTCCVTEIPFDAAEYRRSPNPVHYLTNVNAARNHCVSHARDSGLKFSLPLDSRCIFTQQDWMHIEGFIDKAESESIPYVLLPQARIQNTESWKMGLAPGHFRSLDKATGAYVENEYAIALSVDAPLQFDERRVFGQADKAELLMAIGCPGPWWAWVKHSGLPSRFVSEDLFGECYLKAPRAIRVLPSGNAAADSDNIARGAARAEGLRRMAEDCNLWLLRNSPAK